MNASSERRLRKELSDIELNGIPYCTVGPMEKGKWDCWVGVVIGPEGTPYEGGSFKFKIIFPYDYPFKPPAFNIVTKIWHINISYNDGHVCMYLLHRNWSPEFTVRYLLEEFLILLRTHNHDHEIVCNLDAHRLYLSNIKDYDKTVREYCKKYAF